ncbi:MAG: ECF-type sigma factor, partial [Longimicrobiales bacterium]|nr:ECF-type sigma factor [Longimicrobiales bacterium]
MSPSSPGDVTGLIAALRAGDADSLDRLFALLYEELRSRAHWRLESGGGGATLNTTALVHEAYLKLAGASGLDLVDRTHFFRVAARAMRQVIVDRARRRLAEKRGGAAQRVDLDPEALAVDDSASEVLALDQALRHLEDRDGVGQRLARGGAGDHQGVFPLAQQAERLGLVGVEMGNA